MGKALESFDPAQGKGEIIECPTSSLFGDEINQKNEDNTQKTGSIEKQHPSSSLIESHNLPLSANNNETVAQPTIPSNPNTTTGQRELSTPPVNTGSTNEARNTSEKLAKTDDNARNLDRVNLNINNEYNKQLSNLSNLKCGKIMAFVNVSWYDPDVYLTDTGDFVIKSDPNNLDKFQLTKKDGGLINRIGAFSEVVVANMTAGAIEAKKLVVSGVDVLTKINNLSHSVEKQQKQIEDQKIEIENLKQEIEELKHYLPPSRWNSLGTSDVPSPPVSYQHF